MAKKVVVMDVEHPTQAEIDTRNIAKRVATMIEIAWRANDAPTRGFEKREEFFSAWRTFVKQKGYPDWCVLEAPIRRVFRRLQERPSTPPNQLAALLY